MAVRFYDEALANKIMNWTKSHPVRVLKPEETNELFKIIADEKNDQPIRLPLITLSRAKDIRMLNTNKKPLTFDGMKLKVLDNEGHEIHLDSVPKLNAIPLELSYQLDIYTQNMAEADEYFRNFAFNFVNYPNVKIEIPYNDCKITHNSVIWLNQDVEDNSDIPLRLFPTQFTRYTLTLTIDDAYLFSVPIRDNLLVSEVALTTVTKEDNSDKLDYETSEFEINE